MLACMTAEKQRMAARRVFGAAKTKRKQKSRPSDLRDVVVNLIERHFCAYPLIPGYLAPDPVSIRRWAVKQIYEFYQEHGVQ